MKHNLVMCRGILSKTKEKNYLTNYFKNNNNENNNKFNNNLRK